MIKILIGIGLIALFAIIRHFHKRNYYICRNAEIDKLRKTSEQGKQDVWLRNLTSLKMGEFGIDTKSPETLLAYWKAQAEAGYPLAEENVRYFEDMVRKETRNAENKG